MDFWTIGVIFAGLVLLATGWYAGARWGLGRAGIEAGPLTILLKRF